MEKNLYIFALEFLNSRTGELAIGGVQTYVHNLSSLAQEKGYSVTIFQMKSVKNVNCIYNGAKVIICNVKESHMQKYFDTAYEKCNTPGALFIIATDQIPIKTDKLNVISIQHGIAFDIPGYSIHGFWGKNRFLQHVNKLLRCIKNVNRCYQVPNTVCVDYNYYNWFRTIGTIYKNKRVKVIPNYSSDCISENEIVEKLISKSNVKKILFARRFCDYRGTLLFSNVIIRILNKYSNLEVTFAGNGPLEDYVKELFARYDNVKITHFATVNSISVHKHYDIAVVPTIYSEGTSLSLIEAMSSGCFPLATHVGGMTNIILDNYNGILCSPDEESLYKSLVRILEMEDADFNRIVTNAYYSAKQSFSINNWKEKWSDYIDEVVSL